MKLSEKSLFAMEKVESLISIYETKRITVFLGGVCDFKVRKFVSNDIAEILLELALSTNPAIKVRRKSICSDGYRVDYSYQATNTYASSPWYLAPATESSTTVVEKEEKEITDFRLNVQQDNSLYGLLCTMSKLLNNLQRKD